MIRAALRFLRMLPASIDRAWLRWALSELPPTHEDVPYIVRRIRELEDMR